MQIQLNPSRIEDYRTFLKVKKLPKFSIHGRIAEFPDEYVAAAQKNLEKAIREKKEAEKSLLFTV